MKYNKLGNTDIEVSEICLGTMTFGEQNSESEGHEQMDFALDHGVNIFDTAELYAVPSTEENNGKTEDIIGTWIAKSKKRDKVIIATKVAGPSANLTYISNNLGFSKERINEAIDRSLKRLQTDYVDLYQLHWPQRNTNMFGQRGYTVKDDEKVQDDFLDVINTMNDLVKAGKIRHWGISNESSYGFAKYINLADQNNLSRPVSIQNPYSLLNRLFEVGNAEISHREDIGLLTYSPLGFGLLTGKYHLGTDKPEDRRNKFKQMSRYDSPQCYDATTKYLALAQANNISLTQLALAFINSRPFVTSNIIGATNLDQLRENIGSSDVNLSDDILKEIEEIHNAIPNPAP